MLFYAIQYLKGFYPEWKKEDFIFDKWRKDKAKKPFSYGNTVTQAFFDEFVSEKTLKNKGEPPDGFRFIESK